MPVKPIEALFFRDFPNAHLPEIFEEIYLQQIYKPFLLGKKDLTIVDVGGNIGAFSYYAKDFAKQVYIVEPAKEHIEIIEEMLRFNKIKNVIVCPYAISNKNEKLKFYHSDNTTAHSLEIPYNPQDFEEVEAITFDEFMKRNSLTQIDLLKLDPEGSEAKIITSEGFAKYADKVKVIVGEWHVWANMEKSQFANVFTDLGYKFNWLPNMKASVYTAVKI